jgi:hypothetical protein
MFRKFRLPLGRLFSLLLASVALTVPVTNVVKAQEVSVRGSTESCFVGVNFAAMSAVQLTSVIEQAVSDLRAQGLNDDQIVTAIGVQLAAAANDCSPSQAAGLVRNVALVLQDLGFDQSTQQIYTAIYVAFDTTPGALLEQDAVTLTATVY